MNDAIPETVSIHGNQQSDNGHRVTMITHASNVDTYLEHGTIVVNSRCRIPHIEYMGFFLLPVHWRRIGLAPGRPTCPSKGRKGARIHCMRHLFPRTISRRSPLKLRRPCSLDGRKRFREIFVFPSTLSLESAIRYIDRLSLKRPSEHSTFQFHGPRLLIPVWNHPPGTNWVPNWPIRQQQETLS